MTHSPKSVLLLGATGTIGRATADALVAAGYKVTAPVRSGSDIGAMPFAVHCALTQTALLSVMTEHSCDAVISCIASRSGVPRDARAIDHDLNSAALNAALSAGVAQFVLLSAICVQRPRLGFQQAKLAFEAELRAAPITWSIVRPTAFFKSLSGQLNRLRAGKPFLLFGDGALTACKPISNDDLARYLVKCLTDRTLQNRILPIGGPGPAMTPRAQGELLFQALGRTPRFKHVPVGLMSAVIAGLSVFGKVSPGLRDKAELARIGRYYATESMLVWDEVAGRYDADATPEFGTDTLADHYKMLATEDVADERGEHAVF
jgi:divinyl chlorophyllide a 8-vinyl-reductase